MSTSNFPFCIECKNAYTPSGDFVESISCSEMFFSQSEADSFVKSLDTSVCDNISACENWASKRKGPGKRAMQHNSNHSDKHFKLDSGPVSNLFSMGPVIQNVAVAVVWMCAMSNGEGVELC